MYIKGSTFNDKDGDDVCYLPFFGSYNYFNNRWILGSVVLKNYFLVYNMTPLENNSGDYIQIGISKRRKDD